MLGIEWCKTLYMWRYSTERKRGVEVGRLGSLLLFPFLIVAAVLSVPFALGMGYFQRRNGRAFQAKMNALGRVMEWSDFARALDATHGTALVERYSLKGPVNLWWTSENIYDVCPYPTVDWWALRDASFLPFAEWCRERYTSPDTGVAFLVGEGPNEEGRSLHSRFESAEAGSIGRWIEVVPPEIVRKTR
jgi:hypothetical protein